MSNPAWFTVLMVALGGALGSVARYGAGIGARSLAPGWPWGTLLVNVLGSFAIGVLFAWFLVRPVPDWLRFGLITGVLGGFTTFSAFSIETIELMRAGGWAAGLLYLGVTLVLGLAACASGIAAARLLLA